ncbi:restriction endonuclease subunit S [Actinoplanes sp. NBRC 103695]|uniref:restriction endonuclease subunit S n=1 Tax=Actinoplanes sp. NBRC 103695 TaxID=3032202 RepID=UPI002555248F|nr:restriction endonuclease subunit S [Actinoplanes sp. NBRC 103695]
MPKITPTFEAGRSVPISGLLGGVGAGTTELHVLRPTESVDQSFLAYITQSHPFLKFGEAEMYGVAGQKRVPDDFVRDFVVDLPPVEEQRRIVDFLDAETAHMAELREGYERLRSLMTERWQVLTRRLVTGFDESHGDSGMAVSWLGRINPRWPITTIGRVSRTYMGTTFPHAYQGETTGETPFIKVGDFGLADSRGWLSTAGNWVTRRVAKTLRARVVPEGSVLYARVGAAMLLNQRRLTTRESIVDDNVRGIKFSGGDPRYWRYLLTLLDLGQLSNPGPVPSVSESQVAAVPVPLPPEEEQLRIAHRLDEFNDEHSHLNQNLSNQVALLKERRQALITAAVTGQLDVTTARGSGLQ